MLHSLTKKDDAYEPFLAVGTVVFVKYESTKTNLFAIVIMKSGFCFRKKKIFQLRLSLFFIELLIHFFLL